jgi:hypothetical protein
LWNAWQQVAQRIQPARETRLVRSAFETEVRERESREARPEPSERDLFRAAAANLRSYVREHWGDVQRAPSIVLVPIVEILSDHLGRNPAVVRRFLDRLRITEPELFNTVSLGGRTLRAFTDRTPFQEAVDELRRYYQQNRSSMTSDPDSHTSPIMGILLNHLGWNPTVISEFLAGLRRSDHELAEAVALGGRTLRAFTERERPVLPSVGRALLHGVMGEWHEGSVRQGMSEAEREEAEAEDITSIAVDTAIGLVPVLDQASDARDLMAHTYLLITREGEVRSPLRWVSLVFSLIGAIPEVGTAIKSLSKVLMRGLARHGYRLIARILNRIERILPGALDELENMRGFYRSGWAGFTARAGGLWTRFLNRGEGVFRWLFNATAAQINRLRTYAGRMMPGAFTRARDIFEQAFEAIMSRVTRAGSAVAESIPRLLDGLRARIMSLDATGRMRLEAEWM